MQLIFLGIVHVSMAHVAVATIIRHRPTIEGASLHLEVLLAGPLLMVLHEKWWRRFFIILFDNYD